MFRRFFTTLMFVPFLAASRFAIRLVYGRRILDANNVPKTGVLLTANRTSAIDALLIATALRRRVLFYNPQKSRRLAFFNGGRTLTDAEQVRRVLAEGTAVCVFPEQAISRTGQLGTFSGEFLAFIENSTPVVPVFLGGLLGSRWSLSVRRNRFWQFKKLPERPFTAFGQPLENSPRNPLSPQRVLYALEELGVDSLEKIDRRLAVPQLTLLKNCRAKGRRLLLADSLGVKMSGYAFLIRVLVARRLLRRELLGADEKNVGLFVPMSVGGCLVNAALALDRRVSVNLNNTFGAEILNFCIEEAGIKRILTSHKMLDRFPDLKLSVPFVCLEDLFGKVKLRDKILSLFDAVAMPRFLLKWKLGLGKIADTDALSIIFTSGSTGKPKGVILTHRNMSYVARGFFETIRIKANDMMLGVLPFFHAFGYAGNFWMVFLSGCSGVLHYNPLEAKTVASMAKKFRCTFVPITPTFLRLYLKRCATEDFFGLKTVLAGAEKLPTDLIQAWDDAFAARPTEGYGATELAPCPMVNIPDVRFPFVSDKERAAFGNLPVPTDRSIGSLAGQIYRKDGAVGRPFVSTAVKIIDPETDRDMPEGEVGMMVVKGPFVMGGYYGHDELTAEAVRDGWYRTGDMARRDADGFVWITGRQNRISKIGGEMVPHVLIEEAIDKIIALHGTDQNASGELSCAVSAVPDQRKGERIVVLLRRGAIEPEKIIKKMHEEGIPNIWIPDRGAFINVESIPILGTGKLDLAAVKKIVAQNFES